MGKVLLFWMGYPPDPNIDYTLWSGFRETMAGWVILCFLLTTLVIIGLYSWSARRKKIRSPYDLFAPYKPLRWLWLAWIPAVAAFLIYAVKYQRLFSGAAVSFMAGAVTVGLWAGVLTLLLAYPLICLPSITPAKYRYRPLWLFYRKRGAQL